MGGLGIVCSERWGMDCIRSYGRIRGWKGLLCVKFQRLFDLVVNKSITVAEMFSLWCEAEILVKQIIIEFFS
jgi:hypothetical protein